MSSTSSITNNPTTSPVSTSAPSNSPISTSAPSNQPFNTPTPSKPPVSTSAPNKPSFSTSEPSTPAPSTPVEKKKSKTWIWILLGGFVIVLVIIIIILIIKAFNKSDSPTPPSSTCPSYVPVTQPYSLANAGGLVPQLTENTKKYLTNSGSRTTGTTSNAQIVIDNAIGWVFINNSASYASPLFYYVNHNNVILSGNSSIGADAETTMTWTTTSGSLTNVITPAFLGMTIGVIANSSVSSSNIYTIPNVQNSNIDPTTDIVILTYNADNTITGSICRTAT